MDSATQPCPKCARPVPASAPKGLCPHCLISSLFDDAGDGEAAVAVPAPAAVSDRVAGYELLEPIGRGGMGIVFRARDLRLDRGVALKLILTGKLASQIEVKRFLAEAGAAARLEHPNIVPIFEVGESEGRHFFAMQLMEGGTLAERLQQGTFTLEAAARLVAKVAGAIHHAHQRGILHRDVKPANILLDGSGEPRVTDFGLAKRAGSEEGLTLSGAAVGTPNYMAPEQARGGRQLTTAADIYSLGAVLYELLCGQPPFLAPTPMETMRRVIDEEPAAPSRVIAERGMRNAESGATGFVYSALRTSPSAFRDLETICLKCLQKEPARRYPSAEALADDLERWLRKEPILARPVGLVERVWKWARRHPAKAGLLGVCLVALAGFIVQRSVNETRLRREKEFAQRQETAARASEAAMRLNLYASDMFLAARALEQGNLGLARRTLATHVPRAGEEDLRGFEWRYYWHLAQGQQERVLGGFSNTVNTVAFSSDGKWIAAGGGHLVHKWNATNLALVATFRHAPNAIVNSIAFSPDGSTLWTGDQKGQVRVWLDGLARPVGEITRGTGWVSIAVPAAAISTLAISERNGTEGGAHGAVALYDWTDLLNRNERGKVLPQSGGLAAFSRDAQWLLTGGGGDAVRLHDLKSGRSRPVPGWNGLLIALALAPDGTRAATSPSNGYGIGLYDLREDASPLMPLVSVSLAWRCRALAFSPDGRTLAAASFDHTIHLLNGIQGFEMGRLDGHTDQVWAVAFSPDGKTLASAGKDGTVRLWDLTGMDRNRVHGVFIPFFLSRDGHTICAGDVDDWSSTVWRRDLTNSAQPPERLLRLRGDRFPGLLRQHSGLLRWKFEGGATAQQWAKMEQFVGRDPDRVIWRKGPQGEPSAKDRIAENVKGVSATAANGSVLALSDRGKVRLWHNFTSRRLPNLEPMPRDTQQMGLSDDGARLAVSAETNVVSVWETATGTNVFRLPRRGSGVRELVFSPDGRTLAVAGEDATVQLYDGRTGKLQANLTGHEVGIEAVAFSPDGQTLVTLVGDWMKLWHLPTGREVGTLRGGGSNLAFSADGTLLLVAAWDGAGRLLHAPYVETLAPP
jgi:WD40 repeat protein